MAPFALGSLGVESLLSRLPFPSLGGKSLLRRLPFPSLGGKSLLRPRSLLGALV